MPEPTYSENDIEGMLLNHCEEGSADAVEVDHFLGRIEKEMNKYVLIQRFYLTIMKKLKKGAD